MSDFNFRHPLIVLDCEMTGPDVIKHQLVEVAAIKCDPKTFGVLDTFHSYVGAKSGISSEQVINDAHPGALEKIRISKPVLEVAPPPSEVVRNLKDWLPRVEYTWVGYNLMLDFMFLRGATVPETNFTYKFVDLTTLVELYLAHSSVEDKFTERSLEEVVGKLGVSTTGIGHFHSAKNDALVALEVFKFMADRFKIE